MNDISKDLNAIIADAEQLLQHLKREVGSEAGAARERLEKSLAAGKARLQAAQHAVGAGVRTAADATDGYVHQQPWTAIGIGAGLGLLAGLLLGRPRD
ncbi:DUF883 family protein [Ramlibacter sp. XY19]|uniref:DUF883 family protein n=1 Tax=Ramlibacter paludis TaxID=2908000 RepID=UPI0023DC9EF1|nr:DUF883 family protein [Ramlibacter paludis]MCG2591350.1 DUF883 family protein [Ramlibacter paludis]